MSNNNNLHRQNSGGGSARKTQRSGQRKPATSTRDQITQVEQLNIHDEESITTTAMVQSLSNSIIDAVSNITHDTNTPQRSVGTSNGGSFSSAAGQSLLEMGAGEGSSQHSGRVLVDDTSLMACPSGSNGISGGILNPSSSSSASTSSIPFRQSLNKNLILAALICALGSSFQHGYNGGVVNAPEKLIVQFINETKQHAIQAQTTNDKNYHVNHGLLEAKPDVPNESELEFIFSLMVSFFCIGGCLGALMTAPVADRIGRREGLFYNCFLVLIACPMMACARSLQNYHLLILGRFVIGINAGLNAGLAPLYLSEMAPFNLRGAFGTIYQLVLTMSILLSNILGLPSLLGTTELWPYLFLFPIIPAALMMATLPHCCESPRFLLLVKGRELQAQQALAWFRGTADGIQEEMEEMRLEQERAKLMPAISLRQLWTQKTLRRPATIGIVIMLSQQLSGINAILFYSTSIFRDAGLTQGAAINATLGMSLVNVLMTGVSLVLVDKAGRKTLHMTGLLGMAICCIVLSLCLGPDTKSTINNQAPGSPASVLAVVSIYMFIVMFASGPGSIPWFLVGELFPSNARALATSIAVCFNWLANFLVTLSFLPLTNVLHGYTFFLFAILLLFFYLFTYFKVPETKGATSEEISALFIH